MQELPLSDADKQINVWSRYFHEELEQSARDSRRRRRDDDDDGNGNANSCGYDVPGCKTYMNDRPESRPYDYLLPMCWHANPDFTDCAGEDQSPINLDSTDGSITDGGGSGFSADALAHTSTTGTDADNGGANSFSRLRIRYNGHALQVDYPRYGLMDGGTSPENQMTWAGKSYNLQQMHLHMPSQHATAGRLADGEIHLVHQLDGSEGNNDLLIIGIGVMLSADDRNVYDADGTGGLDVSIANYWMGHAFGLNGLDPGTTDFAMAVDFPPANQYCAAAPCSEDDQKLGGGQVMASLTFKLDYALEGLMDTADIMYTERAANRNYYQYDGSLTAPPCTASAKWVILERTVLATAVQIANYKRMFPDPMNNRPLQLLNGRTVTRNGAQSNRGTDLSPCGR